MSFRSRSRSFMVPALLTLSLVLLAIAALSVRSVTAESQDNQVTLTSYELIGTLNIPTGAQFEGTEIGGLSSITYDRNRGVYYA
ncbi:MAG: hypothetical protein P8Y14_29405, partial [Anaerolineales bacterium]